VTGNQAPDEPIHGRQTDGTTSLDADELDDLIPTHITTRRELNEWEQANILAAVTAPARRRNPLTMEFLTGLHRRMFGQTWKWAGQFRRTEKTIGVAREQIELQLHDLLEDARYWVAHATYLPDEIAARFHHRLVLIHPFPNGNGRHARLMTDQLARYLGQTPFTWGSASLNETGSARNRYISALKDADRGDITALLAFVRM
jgi:Fic-DOC domain mobile mystery protein B